MKLSGLSGAEDGGSILHSPSQAEKHQRGTEPALGRLSSTKPKHQDPIL